MEHYKSINSIEEEFQEFAYKKWCERNDQVFNPVLAIPKEFIEALYNGEDEEYEEPEEDYDGLR